MTRRTIGLIAALVFVLTALAVRAGQDFSGANQSDDPCYKIKQMKKYIMASSDYKKAVGSRDPAYIQCYPLTITVEWQLNDTEQKSIGTDDATITLTEEYPAYLLLHYGWFDKLQKKQLEKYEILGPEPCFAPCPSRAKVNQFLLDGQSICCLDYPYCRQKSSFRLTHFCFQTIPAAADDQYASFHFRYESGGYQEGEIRSSRLARTGSFCNAPKTCGRFWDPFNYQLEIDGSGIASPSRRIVTSKGLPTPDEIMKGLQIGELKKTYDFSARYAQNIPGGSNYILQGKALVTISFAPIQEERWRITVEGWQQDRTAPPIIAKHRDGKKQTLPIWMEIWHNLTGEFVIRKTKATLTYKEGSVTKYGGATKLHFNSTDLYKCDVIPCPGLYSWGSYTGSVLLGEVTGHSVKLEWVSPGDAAKACVLCKPLKSYLDKVPYREEFGSGILFTELNHQVLPLKSGYTKEGKLQDVLKYKITLTKVK